MKKLFLMLLIVAAATGVQAQLTAARPKTITLQSVSNSVDSAIVFLTRRIAALEAAMVPDETFDKMVQAKVDTKGQQLAQWGNTVYTTIRTDTTFKKDLRELLSAMANQTIDLGKRIKAVEEKPAPVIPDITPLHDKIEAIRKWLQTSITL